MVERRGSGKDLEVATLGGGCFWCTEAVFSQLKGVKDVVCGYSGGFVENPTYEMVCSDTTGHAEVVQITYDPKEITYREILEVFFSIHDPTTPNRQGPDHGSQYRSIILYHNDEQKEQANELIREISEKGLFEDPVVTEVVPFSAFYRAEEYHQHYFEKHPDKPYCRIVVQPKVQKLRKKFTEKLKN
jgi:peptide-methionine (S)-S-oxide reductase